MIGYMRIPSSQKNVHFISHIYAHRIVEPISQTALAKELGISRQALVGIEKGTSQPSLYTAFRIAKYFGTPVEKIFSFL